MKSQKFKILESIQETLFWIVTRQNPPPNNDKTPYDKTSLVIGHVQFRVRTPIAAFNVRVSSLQVSVRYLIQPVQDFMVKGF